MNDSEPSEMIGILTYISFFLCTSGFLLSIHQVRFWSFHPFCIKSALTPVPAVSCPLSKGRPPVLYFPAPSSPYLPPSPKCFV